MELGSADPLSLLSHVLALWLAAGASRSRLLLAIGNELQGQQRSLGRHLWGRDVFMQVCCSSKGY
jgi:hypothetical protein